MVPRPRDHRALSGRADRGGSRPRRARGRRRGGGRRRLDRGEAIEAVALLEAALAADPDHIGALHAFVAAHEVLLAQHGAQHVDDFENFWLTGWLRYQIAVTTERLERLT